MLRLTGHGSNLRGLQIHLNSKSHAVGVRPNSHFQTIEQCLFAGIPATGTGVRGGGILYFAMRDNTFLATKGRAVDLMKAYADGSPYYGVNVGWFERNIFAGEAGAVRAQGIFTIFNNDFEGGSGRVGPALEVAGDASANVHAYIEKNYFECAAAGGHFVLLSGSGVATSILRNDMLASTALAGSYGVKATGGYLYNTEITGNAFRTDVGLYLTALTNTSNPGLLIGPNRYTCNTPIRGYAGGNGAGYVQDPALGNVFSGDVRSNGAVKVQAVGTGNRPTAASKEAGAMIFDTTLNKPIWSDGTHWRDATGAVV
jgi:hypothetical protein